MFHVNAGFMHSLQHLEELNGGQTHSLFFLSFQSSGCFLPEEDFQRCSNQRCFEAGREEPASAGCQLQGLFLSVFFSSFLHRRSNICVSACRIALKQLRLGQCLMNNLLILIRSAGRAQTSSSLLLLLLSLLSTTRQQTELLLCFPETITDLQTGPGNKPCND